jgi:hypothetical protein
VCNKGKEASSVLSAALTGWVPLSRSKTGRANAMIVAGILPPENSPSRYRGCEVVQISVE